MTNGSPEAPLLLSVRDVASRLGIGINTTYKFVREGRIRSISVGRRRLIPLSELQDFIEREAVS